MNKIKEKTFSFLKTLFQIFFKKKQTTKFVFIIKGLKNIIYFYRRLLLLLLLLILLDANGRDASRASVALLAACFSLCRCLVFRIESLHLSNAELKSSSGGQIVRISSLKKVKIGQKYR
jgi:hypothetical protein